MTEYMDELICLFRKARPYSQASFQDEEVQNQLLSGLPSNVMETVAGYLDLMAAEITTTLLSHVSLLSGHDHPLLSHVSLLSGHDL